MDRRCGDAAARARGRDACRRRRGRSLPGALKTELLASVVELDDRSRATRRTRRSSAWSSCDAQRARSPSRNGLRRHGRGLVSDQLPSEQEIAPVDRYREFVEYAGPVRAASGRQRPARPRRRCPTPRRAFRVMETILPWLPVVLALSANSPYFEGARHRDALDPRGGARPAAAPRCAAGVPLDYARVGACWSSGWPATGLASDYTSFWWDVRPHPRFGTLEVRTPDQATSIERTACARRAGAGALRWALDSPPRAFDPASGASTSRTAGRRSRFGPHGGARSIPIATRRSRSPSWRRELPVPLRGLDSESVRGRPPARGRPCARADALSARTSSSGR